MHAALTKGFIDKLQCADLITEEENHFILEHLKEIQTRAKATGFDFLFDGTKSNLVANMYLESPNLCSSNIPIKDTFDSNQEKVIRQKIEVLRQAIRNAEDKIRFLVIYYAHLDGFVTGGLAYCKIIKGQNDIEFCLEKLAHWDKNKIYIMCADYFCDRR